MYGNKDIEKIMVIHRRCGDPVFRMAISHLFDVGYRHLTEENVTATKESIQKETSKNSFMTADFQCALVDTAFELSQISTWSLLLYIKLYVSMDGDDLKNREDAENTIRMWATEKKKWKEAIEDPDIVTDIVSELVEQHMENNYTREEIESAFSYVLETA